MKAVGNIGLITLISLFLILACDVVVAKGISINGQIINLEDYDTKDSYLQLVIWDPQNKNQQRPIRMSQDITGRLIEVQFESEFPKLKTSDNGKFKYRIEGLKPGRYILAIQHLKPVGFTDPINQQYLTRPLAREGNKLIVIEISEKDKPPFSIDLSQVFIPFTKDKRFFIMDFSEFVFFKTSGERGSREH